MMSPEEAILECIEWEVGGEDRASKARRTGTEPHIRSFYALMAAEHMNRASALRQALDAVRRDRDLQRRRRAYRAKKEDA